MTELILSCFELKKEDIKDVRGFYYKDMRIILGKGQKIELSKSGKTFNLIQLDENGDILGQKNFRCNSCIFFNEIYD